MKKCAGLTDQAGLRDLHQLCRMRGSQAMAGVAMFFARMLPADP